MTAIAVGFATCGVISLFGSFDWSGWFTSRDWGMLHFYRGSCGVIWGRVTGDPTDMDAKIETRPKATQLRINFGEKGGLAFLGLYSSGYMELLLPDIGPPNNVQITSTNSLRIRTLRLPVFPIAALLLVYPTVVVIRQRRRRRRNQCLKCGYNLTGLSEPRCPECGTPTGRRG